jgi:aspartyl-tRNA(Asn)/glutamyl-tRNA(Gln) amidotransferase subunit A
VGALGSDTGGSIRMPAAVTGIAGLKPTYGRISRAGVLDLSWSCDHVGPMTRTVADCAHMMNVLSGYDPADPASSRQPVPDFTSGLDSGFKGLRVGVPKEFFFDDIDPEIEAAVRAGITLMESEGASVRDVSMPWVALGRTINIALLGSEAAALHREIVQTRGDELSPAIRARLESAIVMPATGYIDAQRARRGFIEQMDAAMSDLDVLVTPSVPIQTPTIAECTPPAGSPDAPGGARLTDFTGVFDTTGQPSLSLNCGFTRDGMPIGMMINGRAFDEVSVLRSGAAFERAVGLLERRPPIG